MGALALLCCYINITSVVFNSQYYRWSHLFLRHYIIQQKHVLWQAYKRITEQKDKHYLR